jgi:hypothetical protein
MRTYKQTGKGFAPFVVWASSLLVVVGAVLALPGLMISLVPGVFANEVQSSVQATAHSLGTDLTVQCPAAPPLIVGETFTCTATSSTGVTDSIVVGLQRNYGWVNYVVQDWGNVLSR